MTQSKSRLFAPLPQLRSSQRVADAIRRVILDGQVGAGEQLPPERTLARRFRVTRNTVREALRQLEQLRLVSIRQGSGVRVRDFLANAGVELLIGLLAASPDEELLREVLELRAVVGEAILKHAVRRCDLEHLDELSTAVAELDRAVEQGLSPDDLLARDFDVHTALIRAGDNRALLLLFNSLRHVVEPVANRFAGLYARAHELSQIYRRLLDALRANDRAAAEQCITEVFSEERWSYWREGRNA